MSNIQTFRDKIVEQLNTIRSDDDSQVLAEVHNWDNPSPRVFPSAMVYLAPSSESRFDTARNMQEINFGVRVVWQVGNTQAQANGILSTLDAVLDLFRSPSNVDTLGGVVQKFSVREIQTIFAEEEQPFEGFEVILSGEFKRLIS